MLGPLQLCWVSVRLGLAQALVSIPVPVLAVCSTRGELTCAPSAEYQQGVLIPSEYGSGCADVSAKDNRLCLLKGLKQPMSVSSWISAAGVMIDGVSRHKHEMRESVGREGNGGHGERASE
jgi:hypothetical protein